MFYKIKENSVICIDEKNKIILNKINSSIKCYSIDCSENWRQKQKNIVNKTYICVNKNNQPIIYKYEYQGKYYETCKYGILMNNSNIKNCTCDNEKCLECPNEPLIENLCAKCNKYFYQKENDVLYFDKYFKCYKELKGYYLDLNNFLFKKCFYACETCQIGEDIVNHNCLDCNKNFSNKISKNGYFNCYSNNDIESYKASEVIKLDEEYSSSIKDNSQFITDLNNNAYKEESNSITNINMVEYTTFINEEFQSHQSENTDNKNTQTENTVASIESQKIIKNNEIRIIIENLIKNETKEKTNEIKYYEEILENIEKYFTSKEYNRTKLNMGEEEIIKTKRIIISFTSSKNDGKNINITNIDLGKCKNDLIKFYNISNDTIFYIKKMEIFQKETSIPKIIFDVYYQEKDLTIKKLNLSICDKSKIYISIPNIIIENIDKLNISSQYYNNFCYNIKSDYGTDVILKDRAKEFFENNKIICQENCYFFEYNRYTHIAKCECEVKQSSFLNLSDMIFNKSKLSYDFLNIKYDSNFNIFKCHKYSFMKKNFLINFGCIFSFLIILLHIISAIILYSNDIYNKKYNKRYNVRNR